MLYEKTYEETQLNAAWLAVKERDGAPGIDGVRCADFGKDLSANLKSLQAELQEGSYKPLPILRFYDKKKDTTETRPLGIAAVRDRIVQHALLAVLTPIFEKEFLDGSFAYRPGRSALDAIQPVEELIKNGHEWVLNGDIENCFASIDHDLLLQFFSETISEDRIIKLVRKFLKADVFEGMQIHAEYLGIIQGNVISPLLANVFLHRLDQPLVQAGYKLIRYADNFVILDPSHERIAKALVDVYKALETLKLKANAKKTKMLNVKEGFVFLGYYIDHRGKGASRKAIEAITAKLQGVIETHKRKDLQERIEDLKQIVRGWSAYFNGCRGIQPLDLATLIGLAEISLEVHDREHAGKLLDGRRALAEPAKNPEAHYRLGKLLQNLGRIDDALAEFTIALRLNPEHAPAKEAVQQADVAHDDTYKSIERLKKVIQSNPNFAQAYRDLAFCYAETGEYGLAKEAYQKALALETEKVGARKVVPRADEERAIAAGRPVSPAPPEKLTLSDAHIALFLSLFRGKRRLFARQWADGKGRCGFDPVSRPMEADDVRKHLAGEETLAIYLINEEGLAHAGVIDIDIDKKALLEYARQKDKIAELRAAVQRDADRISSVCQNLKVHTLIEDSGYKGRHLWFFFATPFPLKLARAFLKLTCQRAGEPSPAIHWEIFPNCDKLRANAFGPLIKLPLGIHKRSGRRCVFLDTQGAVMSHPESALEQTQQNMKEDIESLILTYGAKTSATQDKPAEKPPSLVRNLLAGCDIVQGLVGKAKATHYLTHPERLTLLYTLGHLGSEGQKYLHQVISYTINYDYAITET